MIKSHKNRHQRDILRSLLSRLTLPVWGNSSFPSQKPDMMAVVSFGSSSLLIHQRFSCVWYSECRWSYPQQWSHRQAGENNDKYSQHFSFVSHHNCPLLRVDQFEIPNAEFYELLSNWTWCTELKKERKKKDKRDFLQPNPDWGLKQHSRSCGPLCSLPCCKPLHAWNTKVGKVC